jgi:hypothetical protein
MLARKRWAHHSSRSIGTKSVRRQGIGANERTFLLWYVCLNLKSAWREGEAILCEKGNSIGEIFAN